MKKAQEGKMNNKVSIKRLPLALGLRRVRREDSETVSKGQSEGAYFNNILFP